MSKPPFEFPILIIPPPTGGGRWEDLLRTDTEPSHFTVGTRKEIKNQSAVGSLVMDSKGRCWRLEKLADMGFEGRSGLALLGARLFGSRTIHYELSPELGLSLPEIKEQARATILANPDAHKSSKFIEDPTDARSDEELLDGYLGKIDAAASPLELIAVVDFHDFV